MHFQIFLFSICCTFTRKLSINYRPKVFDPGGCSQYHEAISSDRSGMVLATYLIS